MPTRIHIGISISMINGVSRELNCMASTINKMRIAKMATVENSSCSFSTYLKLPSKLTSLAGK